MHRVPGLVLILSLLASLWQARAITSLTPAPYRRVELTIPVNVSTNVTDIAFDTPENQTQVTGLVQQAFSFTSNVSALQIGTVPLTASYNIYGELFIPSTWIGNGSGVLQFAVHGLNLDRTYWYIGGPASSLNYVEATIRAEDAIFVFDRLGSGQSSKPDGIKEVQTAVHIAVIDNLISFFRSNGVSDFSFKTIVGVGHSYGSYLLAALVANYAGAVDALILTGFTVDTAAVPIVNAGLGLTIASQANSTSFGSLSNSYMASGESINLQQVFLHSPAFPPSALDYLTEHRGVMTIGEFLTRGQALSKIASNFLGPVLIVTGDKDVVECGGNCFQSLNGSSDLLEPARSFFPNASDFQTYIPAQTGHCLHAHYSAPGIYNATYAWIARRVLTL